QTQQLATSSPPGTVIWNPVNLDTEVSDAWAGHLTTANPSQYYAQFPGWYLAEFTAPLSYSGGTGSVSAGIIAQEGTSPAVTIGGQRAKNSGTASRFVQPSAAKLLQFSVTGPNAGPGVNWVQGAVYQDTGAAQTLVATGTRYAQLQLEWLCALTGDPSLPVPSNDAWPQPPDVVG